LLRLGVIYEKMGGVWFGLEPISKYYNPSWYI
jgi:hypothetical protein